MKTVSFVNVQNLGAGNKLISENAFPHCFKPGLVSASTEGTGTVLIPSQDDTRVQYQCTGVGEVFLTTEMAFKPEDVIVIPPPEDVAGFTVAAIAVVGIPNTKALVFSLESTFHILQNPEITLVEWRADPFFSQLSQNPASHGGGVRILPDRPQSVPEDPDPGIEATRKEARRRVLIRIQVTPPIPGINVGVRVMDVDDPTADTRATGSALDREAGPDNRREDPRDLTNDTFPTTTGGVLNLIFIVTPQPGNNYRVVATTNPADLGRLVAPQPDPTASVTLAGNAISVSGTVAQAPIMQSELLTVWRRLHVEVDSMAAIPTFGNESNIVRTRIVIVYRVPRGIEGGNAKYTMNGGEHRGGREPRVPRLSEAQGRSRGAQEGDRGAEGDCRRAASRPEAPSGALLQGTAQGGPEKAGAKARR